MPASHIEKIMVAYALTAQLFISKTKFQNSPFSTIYRIQNPVSALRTTFRFATVNGLDNIICG